MLPAIFVIMKALLTMALISLMGTISAQKVTTEFRVEGLCGMCENRIEAALDVAGVVSAEWDLETKVLQVTYREKKISEEQLHALIHAVGHDTSEGKATDEQYAALHGCCKYREGASCTNDGKE